MPSKYIPGSFFQAGGIGQLTNNIFTSTWDTENLGGTGSLTKVILLPWTNPGQDIDWGDGTVNQLNTHTYSVGGVKTIKIMGSITSWRFNNGGDKSKLLTVSNTGELVIDGSNMFFGCGNMTMWVNNSSISVTTNSMSSYFRDCMSLTTLDVSSFNTSSVAAMVNTFTNCGALTALDVSSFDTSGVTSIQSMFNNCALLESLDVSSYDTSIVTNMQNVFLNCSSLATLTGVEDFDIGLTTNMNRFLEGATLPTVQYSELLVNYEAQAVQNNVAFHGGDSEYSAGAAATARADLIADHTWTITDGGLEP